MVSRDLLSTQKLSFVFHINIILRHTCASKRAEFEAAKGVKQASPAPTKESLISALIFVLVLSAWSTALIDTSEYI
jgi:hypothetical protein